MGMESRTTATTTEGDRRMNEYKATIAAKGMRFMTEMFFRQVKAPTRADAIRAIESALKDGQYIYHISCLSD